MNFRVLRSLDAEPKNLHELGHMNETVAKRFRFLLQR
jgi:hypothetical protein